MKLLNILLLPLFIFSISICQAHPKKTKKENVVSRYNLMNGANIKAMVQVQIDSARARDYRGEIKSCMYISSNIENMNYSNNENISLESEPFININQKIITIVGFSVLIFLLVFIKRMIRHHMTSTDKKEEVNRNSVKTEELIDKDSTDLEQIRHKLNPNTPEIKEVSISRKANGMKVTQGEMILAAKIKSYQLAHFSNK